MMASSEAESYYLLVDSDNSSSTGYDMGAIGAEYMLQLTGWNHTVESSSLSRYSSSSDRLNWNAWDSLGSLSHSTNGDRIEACAAMPITLGNSARFMMLSKDWMERGAVSYAAPLKGTVLLIEQDPTDEVASDGLVPKLNSVNVLTLRLTSEVGSGTVEQIDLVAEGAPVVAQTMGFSLKDGETRVVTIAVDTSVATIGQDISVELLNSGVVSSYDCVEIVGTGASAYVSSPPTTITIDGAFADWEGRLSTDLDTIPVTKPSVDIDKVGNVSNSGDSYFYISVEGEICSGAYVPAKVAKPSGSGGGGGGVVTPTRQTAEDIMRIYVDSDKSNLTGQQVTLDSKLIGADQLIEVKGLFGKITSTKEFDYSQSSKWTETNDVVKAVNDAQRMEIGVTAASLDGSSDIDFIVESTSWKGQEDLATFYPSSSASTRTWVVEPITTSPFATSMSYQRKMFYDGVNYWSFFFNGADTVCKYSMDDGHTWVFSGRVFTTPGVNETSIWYDSTAKTVYAVGDTSTARRSVSIQVGTVNAPTHTISWANIDSELTTSSNPLSGKNTYISKDLNGYLWVLSANLTKVKPEHDLSAFKSTAVNDTSSWVNTGEILPYGEYESNSKGSIVPAGSGSDMWAVYTYEGYVAAKKYHGTWPAVWDERLIYAGEKKGSWDNTDNSPPSVVVDGNGVVHVVYGTGFIDVSGRSVPRIQYSHSNTDLTFTAGLNLDESSESIGNYYPTISLETSTDSLYVLWLQSDTTLAPKTVIGKKCVSGTWSWMTIEPQTSYTKLYMTSVYSISGQYKVCWQWTQNTTSQIEVLYDSTWIPEFENFTLPIFGIIAIFAAYRHKSKRGRAPSQ